MGKSEQKFYNNKVFVFNVWSRLYKPFFYVDLLRSFSFVTLTIIYDTLVVSIHVCFGLSLFLVGPLTISNQHTQLACIAHA